MDFEQVHKIYFIGIGGIGMSAAAGLAKESELEVVGSDAKSLYDPARAVLEEHQIPYFVGYDANQVKDSKADMYVASAGEDMSNPEIAYLRENDIEIYSLSEFLYLLSQDHLRVVVAGTHGKSTTAGMFGKTLSEIDDSSYMTGAVLQQSNSNYHKGEGHYFVFEGDEYKALFDDPTPKFQQYKPDILVLTNLEYDHPDVFATLEELEDEFKQLLHSMPQDGLVSFNADNASLVQLMHEVNTGHVSFGIHNKADFQAQNIIYTPQGAKFDIVWTKVGATTVTEQYSTNLFGEINVYNALAVIATLRTLGFEQTNIQDGLSSYFGVKRRFELIGEKNNVTIYDDYAHHPTAVRETLFAARTRYENNRVWAIFEPHTFSRTEATLDDLAKSFIAANKVLVAEIYPARERKNENSITSEEVVEAIAKHHSDARLVSDKQSALQILQNEVEPGDVIIVMAVGAFNLLAKELLENL
ncbi:MAG: UDP-N-acetylmuramate--L-alanine ligase [bacterium]|nr:UDP-N-acetylmuramate--L-alanine ligase [bacterium]